MKTSTTICQENGNSSRVSKEVKFIAQVRAALERGVRPNLVDLNMYIQDNLEPLSKGGWEDLASLLTQSYGLSRAELAGKFSPPATVGQGSEIDDFVPMLKEIGIEGWLSDLVEHTSGMEAPSSFSFFSGLAVLGAALQRRVYVEQYYYQIWPAMQVMIVGPSQKVKKSTAAGYVVSLGVEANAFPMLMQEGSQEGLKGELAEQCREHNKAVGMIFASDMANFLGEKDYNKDMAQSLTDIFDSRTIPIRRRTQKQGSFEIKNVAVSCILCSNERWARTAIPPSAFEGGFMARVICIHELFSTRIIPSPKPRPPQERVELVNWLKRIQFVNGVASMDGPAGKYYHDKYIWLKKHWPEDERLNPFWERYPDHMLRFAMLLSLNENREQHKGVMINDRHIIQADRLLDWVTQRLPGLYADLGMTSFGDSSWEITSFIHRSGGRITEGKLFRRMLRKMGRTQLAEHLRSLHTSRILRRRPSKDFDGEWEYVLMRDPKEI
jgi:hypothetical protein